MSGLHVLGANGAASEIPWDWWCVVHNRHLTYDEWRRGGCSWCDPSYLPTMHLPAGKKMSDMSETWKNRYKACERIRSLSEDQRSGLVPIDPYAFKAEALA